MESIGYLVELPLFEPIYEDELHVLQICPLYEDLRSSMSRPARDLLSDDLQQLFTERSHALPLSKLLTKMHQRRFPPKKQGGSNHQTRLNFELFYFAAILLRMSLQYKILLRMNCMKCVTFVLLSVINNFHEDAIFICESLFEYLDLIFDCPSLFSLSLF